MPAYLPPDLRALLDPSERASDPQWGAQRFRALAWAIPLSVTLHLVLLLRWEPSAPATDFTAAVAATTESIALILVREPAPPQAEPIPRLEGAVPPTAVPQAPAQPQARPVPIRTAVEPEPLPRPTAQPAPSTARLSSHAVSPKLDAAAQQAEVREHYLARLFQHIEQHKYYPAEARRRGMQAAVRVRFHLSASGTIEALSVQDGPKLLRQAASTALEQALPLPQPPDGLVLPLEVEYVMNYALQ